eukprot:8773427-Lingulodinium_polyedra.AAC.1
MRRVVSAGEDCPDARSQASRMPPRLLGKGGVDNALAVKACSSMGASSSFLKIVGMAARGLLVKGCVVEDGEDAGPANIIGIPPVTDGLSTSIAEGADGEVVTLVPLSGVLIAMSGCCCLVACTSSINVWNLLN